MVCGGACRAAPGSLCSRAARLPRLFVASNDRLDGELDADDGLDAGRRGHQLGDAAGAVAEREVGVRVQVDESHGDPRPPGAEPLPVMLARPAEKGERVVSIGSEGMLFIFVVDVVLVVATALLARRKGRSAALWAVVALFLPLIALVIVLLLPARTAPAGGSSA